MALVIWHCNEGIIEHPKMSSDDQTVIYFCPGWPDLSSASVRIADLQWLDLKVRLRKCAVRADYCSGEQFLSSQVQVVYNESLSTDPSCILVSTSYKLLHESYVPVQYFFFVISTHADGRERRVFSAFKAQLHNFWSAGFCFPNNSNKHYTTLPTFEDVSSSFFCNMVAPSVGHANHKHY